MIFKLSDNSIFSFSVQDLFSDKKLVKSNAIPKTNLNIISTVGKLLYCSLYGFSFGGKNHRSSLLNKNGSSLKKFGLAATRSSSLSKLHESINPLHSYERRKIRIFLIKFECNYMFFHWENILRAFRRSSYIEHSNKMLKCFLDKT
ncbi:hypothetical protein BpHYR1_037458 [Brachionus plicatilis]|uniref:Uncharacterized protein n=1 Tax=Brachionus plicatilis TaxID=10195 RepID=A0A3M7S6T7_BRAPC|nr:hypothetical protein BpHYR1_037458 [Brachionus plicatilis]